MPEEETDGWSRYNIATCTSGDSLMAEKEPIDTGLCSEVSAVLVAETPPQARTHKSALEELREFCTWQNVLSCAVALCAGAVVHNPRRVWRWVEHRRLEFETLGAAWETAGVLVAVVLAANAFRVYTAMARRQLNATTYAGNNESDGPDSTASNAGHKVISAKKRKKMNTRPKLEFIRK